MTPIPPRHLEQAVLATMKPPRPVTTSCPCGLKRATLRHLATCPAVMPSVRRWADSRLQKEEGLSDGAI